MDINITLPADAVQALRKAVVGDQSPTLPGISLNDPKIDYGQLTEALDFDRLSENVAGQLDLSDVAEYVADSVSTADIASEIDLDEVASRVDVDMRDLANNIDIDDVAAHIDLADLVACLDVKAIADIVLKKLVDSLREAVQSL